MDLRNAEKGAERWPLGACVYLGMRGTVESGSPWAEWGGVYQRKKDELKKQLAKRALVGLLSYSGSTTTLAGNVEGRGSTACVLKGRKTHGMIWPLDVPFLQGTYLSGAVGKYVLAIESCYWATCPSLRALCSGVQCPEGTIPSPLVAMLRGSTCSYPPNCSC